MNSENIKKVTNQAIRAGQQPQEFLAGQLQGDWGDLCEEDRQENALSLERSFRILSRYNTSAGRALSSSPKLTTP
jgi:hypothetical protein